MSAPPVSPAVPVRPPRPVTVTIAFWLQLAAVAVLLLLLALVVSHGVHFAGEIDRIAGLTDADPSEVSAEQSSNLVMTVVTAVPALLLAGWLAACARPLRRGSNVARILTFVAAGGQLLVCLGQCAAGLLVVPAFFAFAVSEPEFGPEGPEPEVTGPDGLPADEVPWEESEFFETLYDAPDPLGEVLFVGGGFGVLTVLTLTAAVVVLLMLPMSNRYFVPRLDPPSVGPPQAPQWPGDWPGAGPTWPGAGPTWPGAGYPVVPPGYLICPDPALHLPPDRTPAEPAGQPDDKPSS